MSRLESFFPPDMCIPRAFPGGLAAGVQLRTPCGPRRVEFVRPGDMIVTRDNGLQPVRLVWRRQVTSRHMRLGASCAPIRLKARVLGPMMPRQDLLLARDHRLLVPGWRLVGWPDDRPALVAAGDIAGMSDGAYVDRSCEELTLYHFVFDTPQVLNANGMPVESLVPGAGVIAELGLAERESLLARFPQLRTDPEAYPPAEYGSASGIDYLLPGG